MVLLLVNLFVCGSPLRNILVFVLTFATTVTWLLRHIPSLVPLMVALVGMFDLKLASKRIVIKPWSGVYRYKKTSRASSFVDE